jgi:hypothetical protein
VHGLPQTVQSDGGQAGLFAVAIVNDLASALQGNLISRERAAFLNRGLSLGRSSHRLHNLLDVAGVTAVDWTDHMRMVWAAGERVFSGSGQIGNP